mgnify:FL=1|tara:strand:+ start:3502 stop:4671 length:1170 start_codon:yes stop_codon:yes gene_type:complete
MTSGIDSYVTVSGASASYKIDSYAFGDEYRQVVMLGGVDASGDIVTVSPNGALSTSSLGGSITVSGTSLDNILTKNTEIDAVLDNILTKNTEIDTALDTIDGVLDNSLTKQTEIDTALDTIDAVLDTIKVDTEAIETATEAIQVATEAIQVDASAIEVLLTGIDSDTDAIKTDTAANEALLTGIDTVLDNILTKNTEIDTALDTIDGVLDNVLTKNTEIDAVLDTIKVDTEAIETAVESSVANAGNVLTLHRPVIAPVAGLDVNIKPSTSSYLSHVYIDLDATGDNPATNTEVIAAPGASSKLVIYGVQGSIVGSAAAAAGNWYLSDGNTAAATTLWTGRAQGLTNTMFELTFPYGVALTTNTALKVTSTEAANHIFINAVIYYRTEAV